MALKKKEILKKAEVTRVFKRGEIPHQKQITSQ